LGLMGLLAESMDADSAAKRTAADKDADKDAAEPVKKSAVHQKRR